MDHFKNIRSYQELFPSIKLEGKSIGFVPTMGALHDGHLSLIKRAKEETDITICSIFVNSKQFNDANDFEKYPRIISRDSTLLKELDCDILFAPDENEIYPPQSPTTINNKQNENLIILGNLANIMEGTYRPGHFEGVVTIVKRLFDIIKPDKAYFGEKDYQQLSVIRKMTADLGLPISIIGCQTIRETDGLAMSSRNLLLSKEERKEASTIYRALQACKGHYKGKSVGDLKATFKKTINQANLLEMEYVEIVDANNLLSLNSLEDSESAVCCTAVYAGKTRLIDNIILYN